MRFCLQCGAFLVPPASSLTPSLETAPTRLAADMPLVPPRPPLKASQTVGLGIPRNPELSPRAGAPVEHPRPSLGDPRLEIDEELLRKSFEEPLAPPGAVVCRFCRGPLDLKGDFCDHCGAPVAEAAPPGALVPKPQVAPPPGPPINAPEPRVSPSAQAASFPPEMSAGQPHPTYSLPEDTPGPGALYPPGMAAEFAEPTLPTPENPPAPIAPPSPPTPPAEQRPSGFMSRLKGVFKRG
jgi:hypothetical protein